MQELYNYKDISLILKNNDYDYIAFALTPWHAYSIVAAVLRLEDMNEQKLTGIVLIIKNASEDYLIDEKYFTTLNVDCFNYKSVNSVKDTLRQEIMSTLYCFKLHNKRLYNKNFYVLSQQKPYVLWLAIASRVIKDKNINAVICDEGAGSYINTSKDRINIGRENNKSKLKYIKSIYDEYILFPMATKKTNMINSYFDMCLYKKSHNKVEINKLMIPYYKKSLAAYLHNSKFYVPDIKDKYVLINTQPISSEEIRNNEEVDAMWEDVIHSYKKNGYQVLVKPHPREMNVVKYSRMGAIIINENKIAQELLLMKMASPFTLISIFSTTLITVPVFKNIDTVCLAPLVKKMKSISEDYKNELERFIDAFKDITKMVSSLDELPFD